MGAAKEEKRRLPLRVFLVLIGEEKRSVAIFYSLREGDPIPSDFYCKYKQGKNEGKPGP